MLEWVAQVLNRFRMDDHGMTGTERVQGKNSHKELCLFGETVLWKPLRIDNYKTPDLDNKFHPGIWLGFRARSDEDLIGTPGGVIRARTVRRLPVGQRRDSVLAISVEG